MADLVAKMTKQELINVIETVVEAAVEEKLRELLGAPTDPDEGLALRPAVVARLRRQQQAVARGTRGRPLTDVAERLGLE